MLRSFRPAPVLYRPFTKYFARRFCPVMRTFFAAANLSIGSRTSFVVIFNAAEMLSMPEPGLALRYLRMSPLVASMSSAVLRMPHALAADRGLLRRSL